MDSQATVATRSAAVRCANDRIRGSAVRLKFDDDQRAPFLCECGDADWRATVMLTLAAYVSLRHDHCRFLLLTGHENVAEEQVVDDGHALGYVVVERRPSPEA